MKNKITDYINRSRGDLATLLDNSEKIKDITEMLSVCKKEKGTLFTCGNGGSSATASHLAQDFQKMCKIKTYCLTDSTPLVTAWSNDDDYSSIFVHQLSSLSKPGDVLMVLSGSGNSTNIIRAVLWALENNVKVVALIGKTGGDVKEIYKRVQKQKPELDMILLYVKTDMQHSEDLHLITGHILLNLL